MASLDAARRWRDTWERCWPPGDMDAIAALYGPTTRYRALAFREPRNGIEGVRAYLRETTQAESDVVCRFGEPMVSGLRAAVEWWASWVEDGEEVSLAGVTVLLFDDAGLVVDHRDYWNQEQSRREPYPGW